MKHPLRLAALLVALLAALQLHAQCNRTNKAFQDGEQLTYDLYFHWHFVWVKAGTASYRVAANNYRGKQALRTDLLFAGSKRLNAVFPMKDTLISITTPELAPLYFRKGANEGGRYTVDEVFYSYPNARSRLLQRHMNKKGVWSEHAHESDECNYDMLSILNVARSFDASNYKTGQRIHFPMTTGKRVEEQVLIYKGRTQWKANDGITYRCLVFSLLDYDVKDKEKELLRFYISDDLNHLPLRIDFHLRFGTAKAYYASGTGLRHPQTAIVQKKR